MAKQSKDERGPGTRFASDPIHAPNGPAAGARSSKLGASSNRSIERVSGAGPPATGSPGRQAGKPCDRAVAWDIFIWGDPGVASRSNNRSAGYRVRRGLGSFPVPAPRSGAPFGHFSYAAQDRRVVRRNPGKNCDPPSWSQKESRRAVSARDENLQEEELEEEEDDDVTVDVDDEEALAQAPGDDEDSEESSLEELLSQRAAARCGTDESEDDDDIMSLASEKEPAVLEPLPTTVIPIKDRKEFVCNNCHLVKARVQLADAERGLCRDCV